jgi:3-oxoadipate enol-lactonase
VVGFDVTHRLADLACPTLFLSGSLDRMSPPDQPGDGRASAPWRVCPDRGAAHISNVDRAEAFTHAMLDALSG